MKWTINHLEDLNKVAAEFLDYVGDKTIFALYGPMGVGKTTFCKGRRSLSGGNRRCEFPRLLPWSTSIRQKMGNPYIILIFIA